MGGGWQSLGGGENLCDNRLAPTGSLMARLDAITKLMRRVGKRAYSRIRRAPEIRNLPSPCPGRPSSCRKPACFFLQLPWPSPSRALGVQVLGVAF